MANYGFTEREARALAIEDACLGMRIHGFSPDEIAVRLGTTREKVGRALARSRKRLHKQTAESNEEIIKMEEMRLDEMFAAIYPMIAARSFEAISVGLKIMDRRAKLRGLDAPAKVATMPILPEIPLGGFTLADLRSLDALFDGATQLVEAPEEDAGDYLDGAELPPEVVEASGDTGIAPARPRGEGNPHDERL